MISAIVIATRKVTKNTFAIKRKILNILASNGNKNNTFNSELDAVARATYAHAYKNKVSVQSIINIKIPMDHTPIMH